MAAAESLAAIVEQALSDIAASGDLAALLMSIECGCSAKRVLLTDQLKDSRRVAGD